jgi:hypothetical protein
MHQFFQKSPNMSPISISSSSAGFSSSTTAAYLDSVLAGPEETAWAA